MDNLSSAVTITQAEEKFTDRNLFDLSNKTQTSDTDWCFLMT